MMSLAEKLTQTRPTGAGLPCKVGSLIHSDNDKLSQGDKDTLVQVLDVPYGTPGRLPNTAIAAALRDEGFDVGDASVNKHRAGTCRCYGNSPKFKV